MEWKVAPSFQHATIEKVDEENHKAYIVEKCDRCGGSGQYIIPPFFAGTCYKCGGAGKIAKWVKAYTPEEYNKYQIQQEKAKIRKAEAHEAKMAALDANSESNKKAVLEKLGFNPDSPIVYIVGGGDTYAIKDQLKELGCKYNPSFNWYSTQPIELPEGYTTVTISVDEVYDWYPRVKRLELKDNAKERADAARKSIAPKSSSEYMGSLKERLRSIHATLINFRSIESAYGTSILYSFKVGENIVVWFSTGAGIDSSIQIGDEVILTGTVKDHKEYNGVKQTVLNRCKVVLAS